MNAQSILAVLAACTVLSTGIGFALGAASQPDSATAAKGGKTNKTLKQIKRNLRALDKDVQTLGRQLGGEIDGLEAQMVSVVSSNGLLGLTTTNIEADTKEICRALNVSC